MIDSSDEHEEYVKRANYFVNYFSRHLDALPNQRDWETGLVIAQQWLEMLESKGTRLEEAERLLARAEDYVSTGSAAVDMHLGIGAWYRYLLASG